MFDLASAAAALQARLVGDNTTVAGVATDSRQMKDGELLVALRGERFDGHTFVGEALRAGVASAALVDEAGAAQISERPLIVVPDTRKALGQLASFWRAQWHGTLIGVTGSNGKTTVKEMIAAILGAHSDEDSVLATAGNLNNNIGMPMMLLRLRPRHRYAVIEMGMNHLGEIAYLTRIARPQVALINNAGTAHIGEVGSRQAIAQAKGEIFEGLGPDGIAILNADDDFVAYWRGLAGARRCIDFGLAHDAQLKGEIDELQPQVRMQVRIDGENRTTLIVPAPGRHNAMNALAAAAAAHAVGVPPPVIATGLTRYHGVKGRLQVKVGVSGATIIDDTYNANPDSVRAAIDVLSHLKGHRVLVLGDLGELGSYSVELHTLVGQAAKDAGIDRLYTLGEASAQSCAAFGAGGRHYRSLEELAEALRKELDARATVLVKGSRFMRMERLVEALGDHQSTITRDHH